MGFRGLAIPALCLKALTFREKSESDPARAADFPAAMSPFALLPRNARIPSIDASPNAGFHHAWIAQSILRKCPEKGEHVMRTIDKSKTIERKLDLSVKPGGARSRLFVTPGMNFNKV